MPDPSEFRRYLTLARRWLWLVVVAALVAAAGAFALAPRWPPVYRASATLIYLPARGWAAGYQSKQITKSLALNERSILRAGGMNVGQMDSSDRSLRQDSAQVAGGVSVQWVPDTQLLQVTAVDLDPVRAADRANAGARAFIAGHRTLQQEQYADFQATLQEQMDELSGQTQALRTPLEALATPTTTEERADRSRLEASLQAYRNMYAARAQSYGWIFGAAVQAGDDIVVFEEAAPPQQPMDFSGRRARRNAALAGIAGAVLAAGVALLIEYLDDTIKTDDDVNQALGLCVLGTIGRLAAEDGELITASRPRARASENFRMLRTNIRYFEVDHPLRTLLVTSPGPAEGKSIMAANLAVVMAQSGLKVVVLDADLRQPRLHRLFGVLQGEGLSRSLVLGNLDGNLEPVCEVDGLFVLSAGPLPPNPAEMLGSQRMRALLDELAQQMDVVLVDSPPMLAVTDAAVLAHMVDGVLLVVDAGKTRRGAAQHAVESLRQMEGNLIGVVLNRVATRGVLLPRDYGDRSKMQKRPLAAVQRLFRGEAEGRLTTDVERQDR
jgi:non-specific protein-tyrosine kinase